MDSVLLAIYKVVAVAPLKSVEKKVPQLVLMGVLEAPEAITLLKARRGMEKARISNAEELAKVKFFEPDHYSICPLCGFLGLPHEVGTLCHVCDGAYMIEGR